MYNSFVQLHAGLSDPVRLGRIRPLRELYFAQFDQMIQHSRIFKSGGAELVEPCVRSNRYQLSCVQLPAECFVIAAGNA